MRRAATDYMPLLARFPEPANLPTKSSMIGARTGPPWRVSLLTRSTPLVCCSSAPTSPSPTRTVNAFFPSVTLYRSECSHD